MWQRLHRAIEPRGLGKRRHPANLTATQYQIKETMNERDIISTGKSTGQYSQRMVHCKLSISL
jgi:hypothetical protein